MRLEPASGKMDSEGAIGSCQGDSRGIGPTPMQQNGKSQQYRQVFDQARIRRKGLEHTRRKLAAVGPHESRQETLLLPREPGQIGVLEHVRAVLVIAAVR